METNAKLYIQTLVKRKAIQLAGSFVLMEEVYENSNVENKNYIMNFLQENMTSFVGADLIDKLEPVISAIKDTGIKDKDAIHLSCALQAECNYFITTDKRLLKYKNDKMCVINPTDFIRIWEVGKDV
jgi:predicted nucleic acid-binding protein